MKINKLNTPEQIEKFIISKPALVNNELNFDGTLQQQLQLDSQIDGLETNQMASWSDLDSIMETIQNGSSQAVSGITMLAQTAITKV